MTPRLVLLFTVLLTALLFQAVIAPAMEIGGWRPDFVLVTVVAFALIDGPGTGARYGFFAGLSADLLSGGSQLVGLTALVFLLVGDLLGRLRPYLSGTGHVGEAALGGAAGAVSFAAFGGLSLLLDLGHLTALLLLQGVISTAVWTALLTPLVARPLGAVARRYPAADGSTPAAAGSGSAARPW
jgi:rod shape-determining protein MreD